ncbi:hypothetical protein DSCW_10410 [Desulfosarcina widdelii]|uniref:Metal-binding protein n=1 Tax=Desulfosarcina widdelii TaxID=947919 RepID=A0A5K7Z582_9BACT|nr:DUF1847 domain-containing protein [Desulfosarcina widdelii]BBO73624.1 hypothetical protein DSCW_10410 [Desulfosarcina widdelii]
MESKAHCARCRIPNNEKICKRESGGRHPAFCPTVNYRELAEKILDSYQDPEFSEFARMASIQEAECYANRKPGAYVLQPTKSRIQETVEFAQKLGCCKLGLAFCGGLQKEAGLVADIFESQGFVLASVSCNCGGINKEAIGLTDAEKVHIGSYETMCNPLLQAEILNREKTDLNIVLGLCVGHDALFLKKAEAFSTVLAAKDRVTGHNPLAAVYTSHSYYQKLKKPNLK